MKKYKEWLRNEIKNLQVYTNNPTFGRFDQIRLWDVEKLIDQMDEPEVLSQEVNINIVLDDLKEHIKEQQSLSQNVGMAHTPAGNDTHYRQYDYVLECIDEYEPSDDLKNLIIPKQELPVIPKYVAKYLEFAKKGASLIQVMVIVSEGWPTMKKEFDWISENDETFARAWLDGYEVEEVDRAYKDGYEKGREHGFYKGYREGLGYKGSEPEKVVIPKYVADWIEEMKQDERPFYSVMSTLMNKTNHEWAVWKSANMNFSEIVAQAWLDGFTVEEEPKYYVLVRDEEYGGFWFLTKNSNGSIAIGVGIDWSEVNWDRLKLTEQEIKDYDERFWAFATKVEELED